MLELLRRYAAAVAAVVAVLARLPALTRPVRADEAGFLLVARSWDPAPDSLFGPFWVDRPPLLIAVFRAIDDLGGLTTLRLVGALVAGVTVLLAAAVAGTVSGPRATTWTAVLTCALLSNPMIDVVAVKGELLALPLLLGGVLLALLAVRRRSWPPALAAGVAGSLALGLKQNLAGALVAAAALLVVEWRTGRLEGATAARLGGAGLVGAALPVLATVAWAEVAGVRPSALWDAVYGFRAEAARVIAAGSTDAPGGRAWVLLAIAVGSGLLPVVVVLVVRLREAWTTRPGVTAAAVAVLVLDVSGVVGGGSYWRDYLLPLVVGATLAAALLAGRATAAGRAVRLLVVGSAASAAVAMVCWAAWNAAGAQEFDEVHTGAALAASAQPGDTLVVFGGRPDLQLVSGLGSPYPYLWSLPMRVRDPRYADLHALLAGRAAPTWFVPWVGLDAWTGADVGGLGPVLAERYVRDGTTCNGHPVYLRRGLDRPAVRPRCG